MVFPVAQIIEATKCPVTATLNLIGGKRKAIILYSLSNGTKCFGKIAVRIPDISRKVLTEQLKELEADGLIQCELEIWGSENVLGKRN